MKTNLDSYEYVCSACRPCYDKIKRYEAGPVVLFVWGYAGESHVGIPLAVSGVVVLVLVVVSVCRGLGGCFLK